MMLTMSKRIHQEIDRLNRVVASLFNLPIVRLHETVTALNIKYANICHDQESETNKFRQIRRQTQKNFFGLDPNSKAEPGLLYQSRCLMIL